MEEPETLRRAMLSDQSSAASSSSNSNLRELVTVREEEDFRSLRHQVAGVSLGTVIACEKTELSQSTAGLPVVAHPPTAATTGSRTLFDIIRDEQYPGSGGSVYNGVIIGGSNGGHKINWRAFKDRLRVRRAGAGAAAFAADPVTGAPTAELVVPPPSSVSSSSETLASETGTGQGPGDNPSPAVWLSGEEARRPAADTTPDLPTGAPSEGEQREGSNSAAAAPEAETTGTAPPPQQVRVSLMTLLEQGEGLGFGVWGAEGDEEDGEEEEEEEEEEEAEDGGIYVKCCVCMVRHKGAAFIPCGHTFCRRCSRELWVSRGNCPLCNDFILEILDIF